MIDYYRLIGPLVRMLDAETAHGAAIAALRTGMVPGQPRIADPLLACDLWGRRFDNPLGLAAGFDKNAEVVAPLLRQGFGFVEVGTVTPHPQPGNPRPRLFRLSADRAIINRMGFNGAGMDAAARRLRRLRAGPDLSGPVGVNIGKNKDTEDAAADYRKAAALLAPLADYLVVNVSSPNTPGLRALQGRDQLTELLEATREAMARATETPPPLLLKIAPDLTAEDCADIAGVVTDLGIDGLIATNTTIARPPGLRDANRGQQGGLSGAPLMDPSTDVLREMYRLTGGRVPIIGVGGVASGADAYAKIKAGASLIQLYSALIYEGMGLVPRILGDLAALLRRDGHDSIAAAVGSDLRAPDSTPPAVS